SEGDEDSAPRLESDDEDENLLGDTPERLRPDNGLHMRPAGPPPPLPAGSPPIPDPFGANLKAKASAPPDENYLPGDWATTHVQRSPPPAIVIRHVQWRLASFQQCLLNAEVFNDFPVPVGTPFRFHNPFTSRAQCEELRYSVAQGRSPWEAIESHVQNRGWRAVVLLNPQPDSQAVHLIAMPHDWHLVSVALVAGLRIIPCCVPRRSRFRDLLAVPIEDIRGRLELPIQVELDHGTVTFRSGDCFRVAVQGDLPAPVDVEPVPSQQSAASSSEPAPPATSGGSLSRPSWPLLIPTGLGALQLRPISMLVMLAWVTGQAMHRPGGFPWGTPPRDRVFQNSEIQGPVQVALHSPFLGSFPAYPAAQGMSHDTAWAQFLNDDTSWAVEFFPVWPGPKFTELTFVPVGADCATVTVILRWRGLDRAALIPRTVTVRWMQEYASAQVCTDVVDVSLPHPLEIWSAFDPVPCDFRLRNGDVIYLHESVHHDPEVLVFEEPWDLQDGRAHQHAPWAAGFRLDTSVSVRLLRPGLRPYLATVPAGEAWDPLAYSFSGNFVHEHPGRWTPIQWTTAIPPQLLLVSEVAALANVVVSTHEGRRVRAAPRFVAREDLAQALELAPFPLTVGGVPDLTLDQGVELRNGDVIFGSPVAASFSYSARFKAVHCAAGLVFLGHLVLHPRSALAVAVLVWFYPSRVHGRGGASSEDEPLSLDSDDARTDPPAVLRSLLTCGIPPPLPAHAAFRVLPRLVDNSLSALYALTLVGASLALCDTIFHGRFSKTSVLGIVVVGPLILPLSAARADVVHLCFCQSAVSLLPPSFCMAKVLLGDPTQALRIGSLAPMLKCGLSIPVCSSVMVITLVFHLTPATVTEALVGGRRYMYSVPRNVMGHNPSLMRSCRGRTRSDPHPDGDGTPALLTLSQMSSRDADVLVRDPEATTLWEPAMRLPPSALPLFDEPTRALAGLALLGTHPARWFLGLVLLSSPASAMIEAPSYTFNAFHVGLFPWRREDPDDTMEDVSGGQPLETVYLSPFTGPSPTLQLAPETTVNRWSEALLNGEPYWGASACPVWPTVSSGAMIAVPCPGGSDVVCLHVTSHQVHYAVCVPRVCTLPWLIRVLSTSASLDIISLAIPPSLDCLEAGADEALHWRTGDLVVALPPDAFTGLFQTPLFTLQAQVRHCAIWSLDFRVANRADVILWTPGRERPRLTKIPARARWSALASTFEGEFSQRYPGRWIPAPWVADDRPHLVLQPSQIDRAHVIVEDGVHTFCADVRAETDAYMLWEDLPALGSQPTVLSVPMPTLRAGTHVRTGDVIYVADRSASARWRQGPGALLAVLVAAALGLA
ncbi:unnamed protein product, partial [Symbiodinium necroappetens]